MLNDVLLGLLLSSSIALAAFWKKSLSRSGAFAAAALGTLVFTFGTHLLWSVMIAFFIAASLVTRPTKKAEKRGRRWIQVVANGGIALLCALLYWLFNREFYLIAGLVSIVGSASDTFGSEIGTQLKGKTYSITDGKIVPPGLSGGVSLEGTIASALGSLALAIFAVLYRVVLTPSGLTAFFMSWWQDVLLIAGMGFLTSILDSYLGALIQAKYLDEKTQKIVEEKEDKKTKLYSGFSFVNNDAVNLISNALIAAITIFFLAN